MEACSISPVLPIERLHAATSIILQTRSLPGTFMWSYAVRKQGVLDPDIKDFQTSGFHLRSNNYMNLRLFVGAQWRCVLQGSKCGMTQWSGSPSWWLLVIILFLPLLQGCKTIPAAREQTWLTYVALWSCALEQSIMAAGVSHGVQLIPQQVEMETGSGWIPAFSA